MILYFVLVGFATGAIGAAAVLSAGGGVLLAVLAYSLSGALGVVLSALFVAFAPALPRPRPRSSLPTGAGTVRARAAAGARPVRSRPVRARHVRVQAHASRR